MVLRFCMLFYLLRQNNTTDSIVSDSQIQKAVKYYNNEVSIKLTTNCSQLHFPKISCIQSVYHLTFYNRKWTFTTYKKNISNVSDVIFGVMLLFIYILTRIFYEILLSLNLDQGFKRIKNEKHSFSALKICDYLSYSHLKFAANRQLKWLWYI